MAADLPDFQLLFNASPEVLLVLLPDTPRFTMVAATDSRLAATHTTREATIGRGLFEIFPDNPDDPDATGTSNLRASLERVIATRAPDTMAVQKYDIRGPDGTFQAKYWSPKNIPVLSPHGEVLCILHRVEDVTELVHASEEGAELRGRTQEMEREVVARSLELAAAIRDLRDANAKLGELDAAKTAFFSNVSHEFRTPLTLMLGPLEDGLADSEEPLGPRQAARIQLARDNALRLLKLVNALLDFSRLEAGRLRAHFAPLDLSTLTVELAGMFQSAFEKAGVRFVVDCRPLSGPVWVDRDMWEKVVPNLVSNAFKFTLSGEVAVRLREEADEVVLEVADTGSGIPEAELPHIFERFHRVAGASGRTHEGTGIGLALVRELVELHGGRVSVQSEVGRGSTFRAAIPKGFDHLPADAVSHTPADPRIARDAIAHATEAASWLGAYEPVVDVADQTEAGSGPPQAITPARVLVVDDNPDLRGYVAKLLASTCHVVAAADGMEALEAIRAEPPDIVLSDVMMPRLDGFGLVRELRADARTSSIPVILLSARAGEESAVQGLDAGSDDYLVKPFSARELLARVRTHVALSRARREWTAELERTNRRLEAVNGELEAFSYSVSHDLRAPLRHVIGFAQLLEEHAREALDEQGRGYLDTITKSSNRMARLIEDLLAFSRLGHGELAVRRVDLNALVREVRAQVMEHEAATGRVVDWQIGDLGHVKADPALLRQVFINLLSNALKYSASRERTQIQVATATGNDGAVVFVRDNGVGFDMAYKGRLFGVFQRLHRADEYAGTGIGLANVKRIIHRHGGRVWAESELGQGATFYFSLPES